MRREASGIAAGAVLAATQGSQCQALVHLAPTYRGPLVLETGAGIQASIH